MFFLHFFISNCKFVIYTLQNCVFYVSKRFETSMPLVYIK